MMREGIQQRTRARMDTHISTVLMAGDRVFKLKRAVKLPYADFATPELRLAACREEWRLNARVVRRTRELQSSRESTQHSEARFAKAFHSNPAPMCITTIKEGRFIEVNDRYCQLFDHTREELIGHTSVELRLWADPAVRTLVMSRLEGEGVVRGYETLFRQKNGGLLDALVSMGMIDFPGLD